jgi:hypothetical protein
MSLHEKILAKKMEIEKNGITQNQIFKDFSSSFDSAQIDELRDQNVSIRRDSKAFIANIKSNEIDHTSIKISLNDLNQIDFDGTIKKYSSKEELNLIFEDCVLDKLFKGKV